MATSAKGGILSIWSSMLIHVAESTSAVVGRSSNRRALLFARLLGMLPCHYSQGSMSGPVRDGVLLRPANTFVRLVWDMETEHLALLVVYMYWS